MNKYKIKFAKHMNHHERTAITFNSVDGKY